LDLILAESWLGVKFFQILSFFGYKIGAILDRPLKKPCYGVNKHGTDVEMGVGGIPAAKGSSIK